jgi:hypothetical protein
MNTDNFIWTDEDVAEYSLKSKELTLFQFKWKKIQEKENIEKYTSKEVLFTTEDGIAVSAKQKVYWINTTYESYWEVNELEIGDEFDQWDGVKYFSTHIAANEYVLINKPCLSINDLISAWEGFHKYSPLFSKLKELAKSKISR